ncbi:MAG: S46 family peptidase [Bacteroidota bacterium]
MKTYLSYFIITLFVITGGCSTSQITEKNSTYKYFDPDTVQSYKFDTGKMWTLEDAPLDYFEDTYSFSPTEAWLEKVQKASLKFGTWCSASFVSEDGLVMTNHHCVDFVTSRFEEEGEDINATGFYAPTLEDERKVPNLHVDQLMLIEDVTDEIFSALDTVENISNKARIRKGKIAELEKEYSDETDLICKITSLYNGGRYSLYGYRRYKDVRAVYINESRMGLYGGDPDNFTYPRYNPDFAFMRVYDDDGNPLKTNHYFKWSEDGAKENEPIFVTGNPGSTFRLKTMAQLEYMRDYTYRNMSFLMNGKVKNYNELITEDSANARFYEDRMVYVGNSAKVFKGMYEFLIDEYLMARKKDFEDEFKASVAASSELNSKYGHLWDAIESVVNEQREYASEISAYTLSSRSTPKYFVIAKDMIKLARQLKLSEEERSPNYKEAKLDSTINSIYPSDIKPALEDKNLALRIEYLYLNLEENDPFLQKMCAGLKGEEAVQYVKSNSSILNAEDIVKLAKQGGDAILNSSDPLIDFILRSEEVYAAYSAQRTEAKETEKVLESELGRAMFEIYGTSIPPDATFTFRISDGELKSYNYNGTIAPTETTFYGMYDRYYSNHKKYPWGLPDRWLNPKEGFDMSTQYNFISTNDITGGNSGSPVLNKNAEVIGAAFDGNIESIPGNFLYNPTSNRMVSVSSEAILQILKYIGNAERIADELEVGKIPEKSLAKKNGEDDHSEGS